MDWFRSLFGKPVDRNSVFHTVWSRHYKYSDVELSVTKITSALKQLIANGEADPCRVARDLVKAVATRGRYGGNKGATLHWLLLEMVDLLAEHRLTDRNLMRALLCQLFARSRCIDREIFFFDYANAHLAPWKAPLDPWKSDDEARAKQRVILRLTAVWWMEQDQEPWCQAAPQGNYKQYLEMPIKRSFDDGKTTLMGEALFRLQDIELALELLRCGVTASALYLWPMLVMVDFRLTLQETGQAFDDTAVEDCSEMTALRYFCRAKRGFRLVLFPGDHDGLSALDADDAYCDDLLLVPKNALHLIPAERCSEPASLSHQARLSVRARLARCGNLPMGPQRLPLPNTLRNYVDLLLD